MTKRISKKKKPVLHPPVLFIASSVTNDGLVARWAHGSTPAGLPGEAVEPYVSLTRVRELFAEKGIETDLRITED